ncbi:MAG: hypothetical protein HY514_00780 [Candidatus Aenigmarchaeota archaeon]|nr:hypothetical protein [Candidatus Aenigmarchaeota archaeon]
MIPDNNDGRNAENNGKSSVITVTDANFDKFISRKAILAVGAPKRCRWCKDYEPVLQEVAQEFDGNVGEIDLDTPRLNQRFKMRYNTELEEGVPQTYFFLNGERVGLFIGYRAKDEVLQAAYDSFSTTGRKILNYS